MEAAEIRRERRRLERKLFGKRARKPVELTRDWAKSFARAPGVYAWFDKEKLIYVGETGCVRERINDCRRTVNHTLRRSIGATKFRRHRKFKKATSRRKFAPEIESKIDAYMRKLTVSVVPVEFGRTEFEEFLIEKYKPIYNRKARRK